MGHFEFKLNTVVTEDGTTEHYTQIYVKDAVELAEDLVVMKAMKSKCMDKMNILKATKVAFVEEMGETSEAAIAYITILDNRITAKQATCDEWDSRATALEAAIAAAV
tara:strand:+ start:31 stop:354 length:324 start_codon:yes stop_codon:yes gene_type:complete